MTKVKLIKYVKIWVFWHGAHWTWNLGINIRHRLFRCSNERMVLLLELNIVRITEVIYMEMHFLPTFGYNNLISTGTHHAWVEFISSAWCWAWCFCSCLNLCGKFSSPWPPILRRFLKGVLLTRTFMCSLTNNARYSLYYRSNLSSPWRRTLGSCD